MDLEIDPKCKYDLTSGDVPNVNLSPMDDKHRLDIDRIAEMISMSSVREPLLVEHVQAVSKMAIEFRGCGYNDGLAYIDNVALPVISNKLTEGGPLLKTIVGELAKIGTESAEMELRRLLKRKGFGVMDGEYVCEALMELISSAYHPRNREIAEKLKTFNKRLVTADDGFSVRRVSEWNFRTASYAKLTPPEYFLVLEAPVGKPQTLIGYDSRLLTIVGCQGVNDLESCPDLGAARKSLGEHPIDFLVMHYITCARDLLLDESANPDLYFGIKSHTGGGMGKLIQQNFCSPQGVIDFHKKKVKKALQQ